MKKAFLGFLATVLTLAFFIGCQQTYINFAKMYIEQNNYEMALEQTQLALDENPDNIDAWFYRGKAFAGLGKYSEMNEAYTKCLSLGTKHIDKIQEDRDTYWVRIFNQAINDYNENRLDAAADKFGIAIDLKPDYTDAYKNLALIYSRLDKNEQAVEVYEEAIRQDPADKELLYSLGRIYYYGIRDHQKAIEVLSEYIKGADPADQTFSDALYLKAISYDLLGQPEKAIEAYYEALEVLPNDQDILINLGRLYLIQENYDKGIEILESIIERSPNDFDANYGLGNVYINIATEIARKARATDDRGNLLMDEQEANTRLLEAKTYYEKALPYLETAVQIDPASQYAWNDLGIAYVNTGKSIELAEKAFEISEVLKSEDAQAIMEQHGKPDEVLYSVQDGKKVVLLKYLATMTSYKFVDRKLQ
ncbi:MAG TPA: tetratricopeptide repeat protein [bacterium]|mgnify:CR=1 FL=1|nr:tetratricopeptide repeat protein [bacterium]